MTSTKAEAQQRADDIHVFRRELQRVTGDAVLTLDTAQTQSLTAYHDGLLKSYATTYDIDCGPTAKQLSLGMRIASFLGALAMAASVYFLFYQFWGRFSEVAQTAILIAASLGSFTATLLIQRRDLSGYFTKLAALVAFACFVLNVAMLGQIYNLTPTDRALVPWALFAFLLAYTCDLRLLLAAGILCVIAFIAARMGTWSGMYWLHFGEKPENFFLPAILIFCVPQLIDHRRFTGFAPIYRVFGLLSLLLPLLVLGHWGYGSYLDFDIALIEGMYQLAGFLVSAGAIWLGTRRGWNEVVNTGITFFVILLYTKFFDWWWELMPKYLFFLVLGLSALLLLVLLRRLRGDRSHAAGERA